MGVMPLLKIGNDYVKPCDGCGITMDWTLEQIEKWKRRADGRYFCNLCVEKGRDKWEYQDAVI